jgi:chromosome partitioning protein
VRTFAIVNQKGGCGKTTTAINVAAVFARRGLRTLLVDMDPQAHCAIGLGVPEKSVTRGVGEALVAVGDEGFDPGELVWEVARNLDLIPSTMRLAGLEAPGGGLHELPDRDRRLARLLEHFHGRYDRCLVDCPPTIGLLTFNALRAVREAIIPVETGFFAMRGAARQWRTIRNLVERIGRPIACHLVPTLYESESALAGDILKTLQRDFAGQVVPVVIRADEAVKEAASFGQPVIEYAPDSPSRDDFERLAAWLEQHPPPRPVEIEVAPGTTPPPVPGDAGSTIHGRAAELARMVRQLHDRPRAEEAAPAVTTVAAPGRPVPATPQVARFGAHPTPAGVRFAQPGEPGLTISVAGDFNGWSATATPLRYDAAIRAHQILVEIPPGRYRYRLVVDGRWRADPFNKLQRLNDYDEPNSLLVVPGHREGP